MIENGYNKVFTWNHVCIYSFICLLIININIIFMLRYKYNKVNILISLNGVMYNIYYILYLSNILLMYVCIYTDNCIIQCILRTVM